MSLVIIAHGILFLHSARRRFLDKKRHYSTTAVVPRGYPGHVVNSLGKDIRGFWPETSALRY